MSVTAPSPAIARSRAPTPAIFQQLAPTGVGSSVTVGIPTVTLTGQTLSPTGIASGETFGALTAGQFPSQYVSHAGAIASAAAFGVATASHTGTATISPVGIPSAEAFG